MRTKEVDKAIKVIQKDIKDYKAELEIELEDRIDEQRIAYLHQQTTSYDTVLAYIEELEAKLEFKQFGDLDSLQFENTYLDKQVIRDKIKELESIIKNLNPGFDYIVITGMENTIRVLKELLEE